ncbi:MAG: beta-ketoacyl-ACP synthase III [Christensenellales bacterium]
MSTGRYLPPLSITNAMLETIVDTSDEWITSRTGICSRTIATEQETTLSMAASAAEHAILTAKIPREQIGVLICATITGDYATPSLSCLLQKELGLRNDLLAFDMNAACSGFVYALKTAHALLAGQEDAVALVIGCDMLSKIVDYTDRSTCVLFGDGAGAAIVKRSASGAFFFDAGAQGDSEILSARLGYFANNPFASRSADARPEAFRMNGAEVFRFAVEHAPQSVLSVLKQAKKTADQIDHFVFHQANERIIQSVAKKLNISLEKCVLNIGQVGNTSAASVAIALDELARSGRLVRGDSVVLSAFGGGLTYGSIYFTW